MRSHVIVAQQLVRAGFLAAVSVRLAFGPVAAQAQDPPWLAGFPTVDRVKTAMQATDPRERALKQLGALWQLQEILKQLAGPREFRGLLPAELKLVNEYAMAHFEIAKAIDNAFPGPYGRARR